MSRAKFVPGITELPLAKIEITDERLRPVDTTSVEAIAQSISENGLLYPLVVRRMPKGRFELIDGGHRYAALKSIEKEVVEVRCYEGPASAIRLIEIDANLARADLSALDLAIHLSARKREYLVEYPETARGIAGATARWGAGAGAALASFAAKTVEETGLPERKIHKYIEAGGEIDKVTAEKLRSAPSRVSLNDLLAFAKAEPKRRAAAVEAFAAGNIKKIAHGLKPPAKTTVKDPVEQSLNSLRDAWKRAPKAARDRFVALDVKDMALELEDAWTRADADTRKAFFMANAAEIYDFLIAEGMIK